MKQYLLSVEDLKRIYEIGNYDGDEGKWDMTLTIKRFLKSKKPIELVAEGKEIGISSNNDWFMCFKVIQKVEEK